jgi:hypothetical protein
MLSREIVNDLDSLPYEEACDKIFDVLHYIITKSSKIRKTIICMRQRKRLHELKISNLFKRLKLLRGKEEKTYRNIKCQRRKRNKILLRIKNLNTLKLIFYDKISDYMKYWKQRRIKTKSH